MKPSQEALSCLLEEAKTFVRTKKPFQRGWIQYKDEVQVYLRIPAVKGKLSLQVAEIQFNGPNWHNMKSDEELHWVKNFLHGLHSVHKYHYTSIETVSNEQLAGWLLLNLWAVEDVFHGVATMFYRDRDPYLLRYQTEKL